ncbi:MAG: CubicO group peptidase (beta-lactamase class C family) [Myxococcota bacterium]|jgi:CubicO group peptidase (beta-lactamase class C family)
MKPASLILPLLLACSGDKSADDTAPVDDTADTADTTVEDLTPDNLRCPLTADARFDALAETLESERTSLGAPGLAVAIVEDGAVVWCAGFGDKHPEDGGEVLPTTLFRMGSVNKMMTATALLQQVDAGTVSLSETATTYLPGFQLNYSPDYTDITVQHLLTHQGGFYDYLLIDDDHDDEALEEAVEGWFSTTEVLISPPGAFWNYSNPNWYLVGRIVEAIDGRFYRDYMVDEVFTPLWMSRTVFTGEEVLADGDYASGATYDWTGASTDPEIAEPDSYDNAWARPAGYAWTSAEELARFAVFLMNGDDTVLSDALRGEMMSEQIELNYVPTLQHYGYGLFVDRGLYLADDDFRSLNLVHHGGDISGFAADLYMVPDQNFAIAILANADGAHISESLIEALSLVVEMPESEAGPDLDPTEDVSGFAGDYSEPWNTVGDFTVTEEKDGTLSISMPALDTHGFDYEPTLIPYIADSFLLSVVQTPFLLTFIEVDGVMYARTRLFVGTGVDSPAVAPPGAATLDADRLRRAIRDAGPQRLLR